MSRILSTIGLAALVCLPCLLVGSWFGVAAIGGALVAFARSTAIEAAGALLLIAMAVLGPMYLRQRRRTCPTCGVRGARHQSHATGERTPLL